MDEDVMDVRNNMDVRDVMRVESGGKQISMVFQAADVAKPLLSVNRVIEKGHLVCFGFGDHDN